jgi:hypothetical protein
VNVSGTYRYSLQSIERSVTDFLTSIGIATRVTSRLRSCNDQAILYRTQSGAARPTTSQHEFGWAFDIVPTGGYSRYRATFAQTLEYVVRVAEALGAFGIAEPSHTHVQKYSSATWANFIATRDIGLSLPIPTPRPRK